jgi:hypothetical protein
MGPGQAEPDGSQVGSDAPTLVFEAMTVEACSPFEQAPPMAQHEWVIERLAGCGLAGFVGGEQPAGEIGCRAGGQREIRHP